MGMEISQHKGITWKFMDRLVRHIRIVSNITGRIREPVAVRFFSLQLLELQIDTPIVMSSSAACAVTAPAGKEPTIAAVAAIATAFLILFFML